MFQVLWAEGMWNKQYHGHLGPATQALVFILARTRTEINSVKLAVRKTESQQVYRAHNPAVSLGGLGHSSALTGQDKEQSLHLKLLLTEACLPDMVISTQWVWNALQICGGLEIVASKTKQLRSLLVRQRQQSFACCYILVKYLHYLTQNFISKMGIKVLLWSVVVALKETNLF